MPGACQQREPPTTEASCWQSVASSSVSCGSWLLRQFCQPQDHKNTGAVHTLNTSDDGWPHTRVVYLGHKHIRVNCCHSPYTTLTRMKEKISSQPNIIPASQPVAGIIHCLPARHYRLRHWLLLVHTCAMHAHLGRRVAFVKQHVQAPILSCRCLMHTRF